MRTANYTDLRANLKGYIDAVVDDCDTVIINRGNGKGVVMISLDEYNSAGICPDAVRPLFPDYTHPSR